MTLAQITKLLGRFPGLETSTSYGTPAFRVRKKLLLRMHPSEPAAVLRISCLDEQEALIAMDSKTFYITSHYEGHPFVLARLSKVKSRQLLEIVEASWRQAASKRQISEFDET